MRIARVLFAAILPGFLLAASAHAHVLAARTDGALVWYESLDTPEKVAEAMAAIPFGIGTVPIPSVPLHILNPTTSLFGNGLGVMTPYVPNGGHAGAIWFGRDFTCDAPCTNLAAFMALVPYANPVDNLIAWGFYNGPDRMFLGADGDWWLPTPGEHAIGTMPLWNRQLLIGGTFAADLSDPGLAYHVMGLDIRSTLTPHPSGYDAYGVHIRPTFQLAATGHHDAVISHVVEQATILAGGATLARAASHSVAGPMVGAVPVDNLSYWAQSGPSRFDGPVLVSTVPTQLQPIVYRDDYRAVSGGPLYGSNAAPALTVIHDAAALATVLLKGEDANPIALGFATRNSAGEYVLTATVEVVPTSTAAGDESSAFVFKVQRNGQPATEVLRVDAAGLWVHGVLQ